MHTSGCEQRKSCFMGEWGIECHGAFRVGSGTSFKGAEMKPIKGTVKSKHP